MAMDTTSSLKTTALAIQSFFSYVEEENLPAIRAHLDKFKDVDSRSDTGLTALMLAAEQGSVEIVQELICRGANVNLDDVDGWTALISAAKEGHVEVVRELLANNANLEHRDMMLVPSSQGLAGIFSDDALSHSGAFLSARPRG